MKELLDILSAVEKARKAGQSAALVTIVKAKGSTYRRPGARMLMTKEGEMVGSISGGCLEGDVFEHAKKVMDSGQPVLVHYDTSSDDDLVWGLGLGCSGVVHLLIESFNQVQGDLSFLAECVRTERSGVLATVFRVEGNPRAQVGSRLSLREDGSSNTRIESSELADAVLRDAREALRDGRSRVQDYRLSSGTAEVFIESIQPAISLLLFGAGHDTIPVVRFAKELGWNVTVVDSRPAFASAKRFPQADKVILSNAEDIQKNMKMDHRSVGIIMTHNYSHDADILRALLQSPIRYLGVLGPRKRTDMLLADLAKQGVTPSEEQVARLYSPAGIDLGAESPEEIALAIVGEIQAVLAGRTAGLLRNRKGPIHDRAT